MTPRIDYDCQSKLMYVTSKLMCKNNNLIIFWHQTRWLLFFTLLLSPCTSINSYIGISLIQIIILKPYVYNSIFLFQCSNPQTDLYLVLAGTYCKLHQGKLRCWSRAGYWILWVWVTIGHLNDGWWLTWVQWGQGLTVLQGWDLFTLDIVWQHWRRSWTG